MRSNFQLANLLGTVYAQGNLLFTDDGTKILSPVGSRVTCFDLVQNKSFTLNYEHRKNIARLALNKQGNLLISVDVDGRAILVNFVARTVLYHFNFKDTVRDIAFSPDGHYFAVACGRFVQVWKTPDLVEDRQFAPFVRHRVYAGHYNDVTSVTWSNDSRFFLTSSKDMTAKIFSLQLEESSVAMTMSGHRDYVLRAFFNSTQEVIYTLSKDGALFTWEYVKRASAKDEEDSEMESDDESNMSWKITAKNFFFANSTVKSSTFHAKSNMLVVGFSNGEFRLYDVTDFSLIQQLSMGQNSIDTVAINTSGEWLAFGSGKLGQLLVYEWQSESYILKEQGHFDSLNAIAYAPDGSRIATASDDGKIKIWDVMSGFCLVTFSNHSGGVTDLKFAKRGQVLFSSSLDGTVRAWDLLRFRNFRTFTAPERIQFNALGVDPSGEVVVAGSLDSYEIYVWSVQTAQILDMLAGHTGPVSCLTFGSESSLLASASWDKTIRIWDIFGRSQQVEPIELPSDALNLCMRPDSKEVAVSTLDGHITIFSVENATQLHLIDGRKDILKGRYLEDRFAAQNSARSKYFTTINYSFDGLTLIAGGNNNTICMYDVPNEVLMKRLTVSQNLALNGTLEFLNSKNMGEGGPLDLIDRDGENSDVEDRLDNLLPGSHRGDPTVRSSRPEIRVTALQFSPTSTAFAAASTEGLQIYSTENVVLFDPFDLDVDITPENTLEVLKEKDYLTSLVMAFRLNETYLIREVFEAVPVGDIKLISRELPVVYLNRLLTFLGDSLIKDESHHFEFILLWVRHSISAHGSYMSQNKHEFAAAMKVLQRFLSKTAKDIVGVSNRNTYLYQFLSAANEIKRKEEKEVGEEISEDDDDDDEDDEDDDDDIFHSANDIQLKQPNGAFQDIDIEA